MTSVQGILFIVPVPKAQMSHLRLDSIVSMFIVRYRVGCVVEWDYSRVKSKEV